MGSEHGHGEVSLCSITIFRSHHSQIISESWPYFGYLRLMCKNKNVIEIVVLDIVLPFTVSIVILILMTVNHIDHNK